MHPDPDRHPVDEDPTQPSVEQWARAQALRAIMGDPARAQRGLPDITDAAGQLAAWILSGELPLRQW